MSRTKDVLRCEENIFNKRSTRPPLTVRSTRGSRKIAGSRSVGCGLPASPFFDSGTLSSQRNPSVGTVASANTPLSLRSPSCPVPLCNGNDVFARPAFGLDIRFGVTAKDVQQSMPRIPPTHQRHLPAAVKYKDLEKQKRERQMARREMEGRRMRSKHECADASLRFALNQPRLH